MTSPHGRETSVPPPAPFDWRRALLRAVIWVAFIGALGYSASHGGLDFLSNEVSLSAEPNRELVTISGKAPPVIELKVRISNNTAEAVTLSAPTACKVFRWQVFARSGDMVQTKPSEEVCPAGEVQTRLAPGQTIEEFYAIGLLPQRYRAGEDYLVHYWYWGREGEFQFRAE